MKRQLRLFMTVDAVGGVWTYALELAGALAPLDVRTTLALLGPSPSPAQRAAAATIPDATLIETGLELDWLATDPQTVRATGQRIAALARNDRVDVVQLNQPALAAVGGFHAPVVAVAHSCLASWWAAVNGSALPPDFVWQTELSAQGLHAADAIVCPSGALADAVAEIHALPERPAVVYNGRTPLDTPSGALHDFAFTAGRLWDQGKNVATLDRAAGRLGIPFKAAGPLAGPNGETITLRNIHSLGSVEQQTLAGCLSARPVFVSAARYEPFGLAVLEAALAGCPLILSDIPTFRELWDGAALFVAADDAEGFAHAIEMLVGDTRQRLVRGDLARRAAARFMPEAMAGGMDAIYRRLVDARRARAAA